MATRPDPHLVFVHLSDIHFRQGRAGDPHDTNQEIRHELERDLRSLYPKKIKRVDGIIITGDISFAGKKDEFSYAGSWIEHVRELVECPPEGVMVIPGNHDVDRDAIAAQAEVQALQDSIRNVGSWQERDEVVARTLRDAQSGPLLLSPIAEYNAFANAYGCSITADKPFWERNFPLGETQQLRIRGLTTTLISGPNDNETTHRMVYGGAQRQLLRHDNVWHALAGHHPPSWAFDMEEADRTFNVLSVLQLFGHKHDQWMERVGTSVRLVAGAVHPDRQEGNWDPRYAILSFRLASADRLVLRVFPRKWTKEERMFIGDCNSARQDYRDADFRHA